MKETLQQISADMRGLIAAVGSLDQRIDAQNAANVEERRADRKWVRRLSVFVLVVVAVVGYALYRGHEFRSCMMAWSSDWTARSSALAGPANARVDLFFQAYTEAAGAIGAPLTHAQREQLIDGLDRARTRYPVVPSHAELEKATDYRLLGLSDLLAALQANAKYQRRVSEHPVPDAPTCGGLF